MNLKYMNVSLFEISYKKKNYFFTIFKFFEMYIHWHPRLRVPQSSLVCALWHPHSPQSCGIGLSPIHTKDNAYRAKDIVLKLRVCLE